MMFLSMTGFGRAVRSFVWGVATFEVVSVNHRYQEISVRLPKEISSLESLVTVLLRSMLKRGKIRLSAEINWAPNFKAAKIDAEVLRSYYNQLREAAAAWDVPPLELTGLLTLPGVCNPPSISGEGDFDELWKDLVSNAVNVLMEMKRSEGEKLWVVVEKDLEELGRLRNELERRWTESSSQALDALKTRIEKVMERFALDVDQSRTAQEVALLSDKWDVSEELARLAGHMAKFREIASGPESEGRKLDFLIQEMNREVNTMGSKVSDAEFRWIVVEAKSCLERIREQIQNVE
jgi:uncharacterized protein (TIGR00255 family)